MQFTIAYFFFHGHNITEIGLLDEGHFSFLTPGHLADGHLTDGTSDRRTFDRSYYVLIISDHI